ncbi:MAG: hypothetical protein ABJB74_00410 [Gemmatimonas sp.]
MAIPTSARRRTRIGTVVQVLAVCTVTACASAQKVDAQTSSDSARARALAEVRARALPPGNVNCGLMGSVAYWRTGAIFVDTVGIRSNAQRSVVVGWCSYLAIGRFDEQIASFVRWSDAQLADDLQLDLGIEWARQQFGSTRIRFTVTQTDTTATARFVVRTVIESPVDSATWTPQAVHTVHATVYKDTARFESVLIPGLASNMRWITGPLEFVRLDTGMVDTLRAKSASNFVLDVRQRLGIASVPGEQVLYLYTKSGNGRDLLGFSEFSAPIDGFSAPKPSPFLFSNVPTAAENYWHELVHVAVMARAPRLDSSVEEPLAKALGGTLNRTWLRFVCEERSLVLERESVKDIPALFAKPDGQLKNTTTREWETAFLIDYLALKSGDIALRTLIDGHYDFSTRAAARASVASIMGITPTQLVDAVSEFNSDKTLSQRCTAR